MPKINGAIGGAAWEVIGAKIEEILIEELPAQATLANNPELNATIWRERLVPFGLKELPAINISFSRAGLDNQDSQSVRASNLFFIDVYTKAKADSGGTGDSKSAALMQRIAGLVRGILESPEYRQLDIPPPFINKRNFNSFVAGKPASEEDGSSVIWGVLSTK